MGRHPPLAQRRLAAAAPPRPEHPGEAPGAGGSATPPGAAGLLLHRTSVWAELHVTPRNPPAKWTSRLAQRVADDLAERGWELEAVMTDNGSEFRAHEFRQAVATLGAEHRFIHARRPQTDGCVERVQLTILDECWKPAFARHLIPKLTGLQRDLAQYLRY